MIDVLERVEPQRPGPGEDQRGFTRLRVVLHEGKKNQIRRMFGDAGHRVDRLVRIAIGPLTLQGVPRGGNRELSAEEVEGLRSSAGPGSVEAERERQPTWPSGRTRTAPCEQRP